MLPSLVLDHKSLLEVLFVVKPNYEFLKTFGCKCFSLTKKFNQHKFAFKSKPCMFIGYNLCHKGYNALLLKVKY